MNFYVTTSFFYGGVSKKNSRHYGTILRVTGPLLGESTGHRMIHVRRIHRSPVDSPHKCQWRGAWTFTSICSWTNDWANNRDAGDLRPGRAHHELTVMMNWLFSSKSFCECKLTTVCCFKPCWPCHHVRKESKVWRHSMAESYISIFCIYADELYINWYP